MIDTNPKGQQKINAMMLNAMLLYGFSPRDAPLGLLLVPLSVLNALSS
jgi:hypothetical protein